MDRPLTDSDAWDAFRALTRRVQRQEADGTVPVALIMAPSFGHVGGDLLIARERPSILWLGKPDNELQEEVLARLWVAVRSPRARTMPIDATKEEEPGP